jgi:hypothetical protein
MALDEVPLLLKVIASTSAVPLVQALFAWV